jgi:mannitol-specific phosphotransferase system IIBC component
VGTVNTAEFIVALAASLGFLIGLGTAGIDLGIVLALLIGGVIAAPLAAWLVRFLNARILGVVVGCFILLLNARLILGALEAPPAAWWTVYAVLFTVSAVAITYVVRLVRRDKGTPTPETSEQGPESVHA